MTHDLSFLDNYKLLMTDFESPLAPVVNVTYGDFQCYDEDHKTNVETSFTENLDDGLNLVIYSILGVIGLLIFVGTLVEISTLMRPSIPSILEPKTTTTSVSLELLKSFSLYSNGSSLLSTKAAGTGRLDSMNGMK